MHGFDPSAPLPTDARSRGEWSEDGARDLSKVRQVNQRWIVHGDLRNTATRWIDYLEANDPSRLQASCHLALLLCRRKDGAIRDPKPRFYAGLFAHATLPEIERFLPHHQMTRAISLAAMGNPPSASELSPQGRAIAATIADEIREAQTAD